MKWFDTRDGETPLDPDETSGLKLPAQTRGELDELEQGNIGDALRWAYMQARLKDDLLTVAGILMLHRKMFGDVWGWAGEFRTSQKNMGVVPGEIGTALRNACDDARFWFEESVWSPNESAVRYHHRLVQVHPFANGNGRLARVAADLILHHRDENPIRWPTDRDAYIHALRSADVRDFSPLLELVGVASGDVDG